MTNLRYHKLRKWAVGVGVAFVLFNLFCFFVLPAIIKSQMLKRLPALTHRNVAVQEVKLNPFALSFTLRGFSLTETNGDEFVSLDELYVNFESISLLKRGFVFSEIHIKKPSANVIRLADGTFNFSNLLPPSTNQPPPEAKSTNPSSVTQQLPLVIVEALKIEDGQFSFTDLDRKKPFQRRFGPINVTLTDFTTRPKTGSPYSVVVSTKDGETFAWSGDLSIAPLHSEGTFKLTGLHFDKYAAYAEDVVPIRIDGGRMNLQTDYQVAVTGEEASATVSNLTVDLAEVLVSTTQPRPAQARLDKLHLVVGGVSLDTAAKRLDVAEIRLTDLTTGVTLLPGVPATQAVTQVASKPATESKPSTTQTNAFQIKIDEVALENASFRFTDESVEPHVESIVEEFNGSVKGLTSDMNTVAVVDFAGKVNKYAPFSIKGKINPLASDLFVDVAILLQNDALTPTSPYASKYVGFPLERGSLSLDLRYYVTQRELKAENKVRVDQLQLGEASNSPDAIKLPVKLGIALLQDRHGVIALNVPVNGRLDDPKFKLGPVIMQVFINIITKAITKPFAMLGSMFGGGEDLDHITFVTGQADFTEGELSKLDTLATALYERPALKLGIVGSVDPVKDREALAKLKLEHHLSEMRVKELQAAGQKVTSVDSVRLAPEDRDRLIKLAYAEAMGLVSSRASASRAETVLAHLQTKTNFEPLHPAKSVEQIAGGAPGSVVSVADMETKLVEVTEVTPDDFKKLMDDRAAAVQSYLLQSGKVEQERLTVAASKTVDASFQGSNRVNLTLQ